VDSSNQLIYTKDGLVPLSDLQVVDVVEWHDNARVTATEWRRNGELVRRDVNVNLLRGLSMDGQQAKL
jgi:hypothetical protein